MNELTIAEYSFQSKSIQRLLQTSEINVLGPLQTIYEIMCYDHTEGGFTSELTEKVLYDTLVRYNQFPLYITTNFDEIREDEMDLLERLKSRPFVCHEHPRYEDDQRRTSFYCCIEVLSADDLHFVLKESFFRAAYSETFLITFARPTFELKTSGRWIFKEAKYIHVVDARDGLPFILPSHDALGFMWLSNGDAFQTVDQLKLILPTDYQIEHVLNAYEEINLRSKE
ncbi:hypothetical protein [Exiguobacterium oxidotolerans]|uniref:Uncharacterized protein n=1 Tax=Exiguobacterium oxidotolerans TaxID=223958 RepID=A0A653I6R2_9BACL|nr:hypothetical protein [Exiguobacterium oxidotolerans]VWX34555.1 conserved hypothetical protein [Exiguobacterium oxidotolerans]